MVCMRCTLVVVVRNSVFRSAPPTTTLPQISGVRMAPMRYGQNARTPPPHPEDPSSITPIAVSEHPQPRPALDGRDVSEV